MHRVGFEPTPPIALEARYAATDTYDALRHIRNMTQVLPMKQEAPCVSGA